MACRNIHSFSIKTEPAAVQPTRFSTMRVAEGFALLAEAALAAGQTEIAHNSWQQARPEYLQNYPKADPSLLEFNALGEAIARADKQVR